MAADVQYQTDENAQILIISRREERSDSEGAILTAEKNGLKITGLGSSAEPHSDRIINCSTTPKIPLQNALNARLYSFKPIRSAYNNK